MLDSPILEVIIGMVFVFSLLSVLVTQVNTGLMNILNTRAKHLKTGIYKLLTDPVVRAKFMAHPLIRLIGTQVQPEDQISAQAAQRITQEPPLRLDWIPAELFSQALMDIIQANAAPSLFTPLYESAEQVLNGAEKAMIREMVRRYENGGIGMTELQNAIHMLVDPTDQQALLDALQMTENLRVQQVTTNEMSRLIPLLEGIRHIENPTLRKALETLLASARSIEEAQAKIEFWFNARMDIVSELYKRNIQKLSFLIGLVITLVLNVDSLHLARTLWDDPAVRQTLEAVAQESINSGALSEQINQSRQEFNAALATPTPLVVTPLAPADASSLAAPTPQVVLPQGEALQTVDEATDTAATGLEVTITNLLDLRLPIGWDYRPVEGGCVGGDNPDTLCSDLRNAWNLNPANNSDWLSFLIRKLIGWAITTVALAQGAPFWFDLLNRVARGRSGGGA